MMGILMLFLMFCALFTSRVDSFNVMIVCALDLYRGSIMEMDGYKIPTQSLGSLGSLSMTILLPVQWRESTCCQRIQMTLFENQLYPEPIQNVSSAEWTLCNPEIKHVTCFTQQSIEHDENDHDDIAHVMVGLSLQQCLMPEMRQVKYELYLYSNSTLYHMSSTPISDITNVGRIYQPHNDVTSLGMQWLPCSLSGSLDPTKHTFPLKLGSMLIQHATSFSYHFSFTLSNPSNDVFFEVLFVPQDNRYHQTTSKCERKPHISLFQIDTPKKISLSLGNAWSGCIIENIHGEPVYFCDGGRVFVQNALFDIIINLCSHSFHTVLNYSLEILESQTECSLQSGFTSSQGFAHRINIMALIFMLVCIII